MKLSSKAENILSQISDKNTKLGDLRNIAKNIKKDHQLAIELWSSKLFFARQLAILIMDKKQLSEEVIDNLINDISQHTENEKLQLEQLKQQQDNFLHEVYRQKKKLGINWLSSQKFPRFPYVQGFFGGFYGKIIDTNSSC